LKFFDSKVQKLTEFYLNETNLENFISGSAQPKLNKNNLDNLCIPITNDMQDLSELVRHIINHHELLKSLNYKTLLQLEAIEALPAAILREVFEFKS